MLTYQEYYNICKQNYNSEIKNDLYNFTYKVIDKHLKNKKYNDIVNNISNYLNEQFSIKKNVEDDPDQPLIKFNNPLDIPEIKDLSNIIIPGIEKDIYGCYASVHGLYVYRTKIGNYKKDSSWLWHIDNHPKEILKCMIYLNDVDEKNGSFCILKNNKEQGYKHQTYRIDKNKWQKAHTRFSEEQIDYFVKQGYEKYNVCGKKGTNIVFDNNIVHRATMCENKVRDVIVFMLKPCHTKKISGINAEWTGSYENVQVFIDPEFIGKIKQ